MKRVRVSSLADQDLDQIWYYTAKTSGSMRIADEVLESIADKFPLFASTPEAGIRRDEIEPGVRGFPVGRYIIYYRESARYLVISRIIHGMRDQKAAFFDEV